MQKDGKNTPKCVKTKMKACLGLHRSRSMKAASRHKRFEGCPRPNKRLF